MFECIEIGKLYRDGVTRYQEGVMFNITNSGLTLEIYFNNPTQEEINALQGGVEYKFGLFKKDGVLFFLSKFGNLNWMDAPYSVGLCRDIENIDLKELTEDNGYALAVTLIDASNGVVVWNRLIGLQNRFSNILRKEFYLQKANGKVDRGEYGSKLVQIYNSYSTNAMVKNALVTYRSK